MKFFRITAAFLFLSVFSCKQKAKQVNTALFELVKNSGINFTNKVEDGKLENSFLFRNFYNGGGVGIGDINNDGLPDIFLTSNTGQNKLYLNKGNFKFDDITEKAGIISDDKWNTGVTFVDINGDGWLDIYVCSSGHMPTGNRKNKLYINNHDNTFTEEAAKYGLDISAYSTQVSFFDYDGDGDLDCFMINNSPIPVNQLDYSNRRDLFESKWPVADFLKGGGDHLYRNDNGHFTEVTQQAGIHGSLLSFGLGVSVGDINGDGWPDIFVSNDSYERDYLYINQKNGTFKDELEDRMQHTSFSSMGADIADINNDGYPDIFTTDMLSETDYRLKTTGGFDGIDMFNRKLQAGFYYQYTQNCLHLNTQNNRFIDIANFAGVSATDWSWGALMFDMDNDGWNDLFVCNGVNRDVTNLDFTDFFANEVIQKMVLTGKKGEVDEILKTIPRTPLPNKVFRNDKNLKFTDIGDDWGFADSTFSNGAAYADLDGDGDLDLIINNENEPASIYRNNARQINHNNYIGILLKGIGKNTFAIGSKIKAYSSLGILTREVVPSRGFQSSVDYKQIIGLGKGAIDSLIIIWPNRTFTKIIKPAIDTSVVIQQPETKKMYSFNTVKEDTNTYLKQVPSNFEKHTEDNYIDFYTERNIPEMLSKEGPKAAVGDVNGDGLEDVFIGGTANHPGQLYLQTKDGKFIKKEEKAFQQFADFEDVAVILFDCDHDGDLDLLVCPGGNNHAANSRELQLRLFKNDGKGNFSLDSSAFPNTGMDVSVAIANDFNKDGYPDLFIGARNYPGVYGKDPRSYLFVNDGNGHFTDIGEKQYPAIANIGMVTGAVWADVAGNKDKELVIVGEWMAPKIFTYKKNRFEEIKTNINNMDGWWQTIAVADVNKDGKQDLILGNIGENFRLKPSEKEPVELWINDFNQNGNIDKILTYTVNGKDMPVFLKKDMEEQIPWLKKNNLKHAQYAVKSIQELFPADIFSKSTVKQFNFTSSVVALNKGDGNFIIQALPTMAQMSSINTFSVCDINNDGYPDLIYGGNKFEFLPQLERLDAGCGDILINNGKGGFVWQKPTKTGIGLRGEVRDISLIKGIDKKYILFLQNNQIPSLFQLNQKIK
jgi:hypothetical protein